MKKFILGLVLGIVIGVIGCFLVIHMMKKESAINKSDTNKSNHVEQVTKDEDSNSTVEENIGKDSKDDSWYKNIPFVDNIYTEDNILYFLDTSKLETEKEITYKLDDNFSVKIVSGAECKLYVNGQYVREDLDLCGGFDSYVVMDVINDTLMDRNFFGTDIRSHYFAIISKEGKMTKLLYQLDDVKGMVAEKYDIQDGRLIIEGTRINHGPNIMYGDDTIGTYICDKDAISKLDGNIYVKAKYIYEFNNGNINLVSSEGIQTLSEYLREFDSLCEN